MLNQMRTSTIPDLIEYGKELAISHSTLHLKSSFTEGGDTIIINYTSILDNYMPVLEQYIEDMELTDAEYQKYRFQPKLLSLDLYGTLELWSAILRINNITSITQFTLTNLKVFTENIFDVINEILILEEGAIKKNKDDVYG